MLLMQHHQDGIERRLSVIGVPTYTIRPFTALMVKWEQGSGVEWTIKRLKSLKVDLIRRRSQLQPLTWIRKNRRGDIAGTIGSLFRWSDKSDQNFRKCVQAFMAYTFYILPETTESQKEKFFSGLNPTEPDGLDSDFHSQFARTVKRFLPRRAVTRSHRSLVLHQGSPEKRAPSCFGRRSVPQDSSILQDLQVFNTPGGSSLYSKFQRLYQPLLFGAAERRRHLDQLAENYRSHRERGFPATQEPVQGGEIHFIQEPGGKLRSIASPFRLHQEALRPLGQELYDVVATLPWDCTFDQSRAHPYIHSCLRQGGHVHSVDLSSATDHFPLSLQLTAQKALFYSDDWDHVDLFEEISRSRWKSNLGWLTWTKGQPLGLYPSFASFTMTHGLLLLHLAGGDYHHQFFVVGDDVVILEDGLHDKYISMLERMSCPYSEDKSLSSSKLAEFAGKIVTSEWVIPQMKWRMMSNDNFLDLCRLLGKRSRCLLSLRQKRIYDRVAHLCEPLGLNISYPGSDLSAMVLETLRAFVPEEHVLGAQMGLRKKIHRMVYTSDEVLDSEELQVLSSTADEAVKRALSQTLFSRWKTSNSIGLEGLETLPLVLGVEPRLPTKATSPTRTTALERYERIFPDNRS